MLKTGDHVVVRSYDCQELSILERPLLYRYQRGVISDIKIDTAVKLDYRGRYKDDTNDPSYIYTVTLLENNEKIDFSDASSILHGYTILLVPSFYFACQLLSCDEVFEKRLLEEFLTELDINEADDLGNTIMHMNDLLKHEEIVELLFARGALNKENKAGLTPYDIAVLKGYFSSANIISKYCGAPDRLDIRMYCQLFERKYDLSSVLRICAWGNYELQVRALVAAIEILHQAPGEDLILAAKYVRQLPQKFERYFLPHYKEAIIPYVNDERLVNKLDVDDRLFLYSICDINQVINHLRKEYRLLKFESHQKAVLELISKHPVFYEDIFNECFFSKITWKKYWAINYRYERFHCAWDELRSVLLSKNSKLQALAVAILEKESELSLSNFYRDHLGDEHPLAAIKGILLFGKEEDGRYLLDFISGYTGKCLYTAIQALSATLKDKAMGTYWYYLQNATSYKVAKEACRALKKHGCRDITEYGSIVTDIGKQIAAQSF